MLWVVGFSLTASYPLWFSIFCLAAGVLYALVLYYRNRAEGFSKRTLYLLAALRTTAVTLIAFLLLSPLLKSIRRYSEKPIVILALDNSASMVTGKDSMQIRSDFYQKFKKLSEKLSDQYEVKTNSFGSSIEDGLQSQFDEKQTDISQLFSVWKDQYSNRNLAATIIATDGIYNKGADPLYAAEHAPYAIYPVAMGDTSQQRDILISRVNYNRIAFLGNDFPVEITVSAYKLSGKTAQLSINNSQKLFGSAFPVSSEAFHKSFTTMLKATKAGVQRYRVAVGALPGEISKENNYQDIVVEVLDSRQKILLLYASPHPDVAALKQAISKNQNYVVEDFNAADFNGNVNAYSLVIMHQVPSVENSAFQVNNQLKNSNIPTFYIIGAQSNLQVYSSLQTGLAIPQSIGSFNEATAIINRDFSLFTLPQGADQMLPSFPPLRVPFSQYKPGAASHVLLYQKVGAVNTRIPLLLFNQGSDRKTATLTGEGIWRWRLSEYAKSGNQIIVDDFISRIIQYLSVKEDKGRFRVSVKANIAENSPVEFDAELYNESYQLVNEPEVSLVITDISKKSYPFTFSHTSNAYFLNAGNFAPGEYSYRATTMLGGTKFEKTGVFTVSALNLEAANLVANHNLLANLAAQHRGKLAGINSLDSIPEWLSKSEDVKTIAYSRKRYTDLVDIWPLMLIIILLLSTEWFLRKWNGSY
jgi:hypothetical protein